MNNNGLKKKIIISNGNDWNDAVKVNQTLIDLKKLLVKEIRVEGELLKSKIAWKISTQIQAYLYRMTDLADGCCLSWNNRQYVSAITLARAILETSVTFWDFEQQIHKFLEKEDLISLDKFIMNRIFATRIEDWLQNKEEFRAVNIQTLINKMDKLIPGLISVYERMSDIAHPNQYGHSQAYGDLNKENGSVVYNRERFINAKFSSILCAFATLEIAIFSHKRLQENILKIVELQHRIDPV